MKPVYFLSDAHLGCRAIRHQRTQERRMVTFLDAIKTKAAAVYLMGDIFDFWYEYKTVVPRGYTRLLGKISELTDMGVEVHFFVGNHDLWMTDYLEKECGVVVHHEPVTMEIYGKEFYLAHGDGLGTRSRSFRFLRYIFHNRVCQVLFSCLHPRWALELGLTWAKHSQKKHQRQKPPRFMGEDREELLVYSRKYLETHNNINYFVFGHRHIELDYPLGEDNRLFILGDWINLYTYLKFDGEEISLHRYVEGETKP